MTYVDLPADLNLEDDRAEVLPGSAMQSHRTPVTLGAVLGGWGSARGRGPSWRMWIADWSTLAGSSAPCRPRPATEMAKLLDGSPQAAEVLASRGDGRY
jgi:hypothetical protein